jgi:hypothetical protein
MKEIVTVLIALMALSSMGLAQIMPDWLEDLGPGTTYTAGEYATTRGLVEGYFTPQTMNSQLTFDADGVSAIIDQSVSTSIDADQAGIDRQLLTQSASAYVATSPGGDYYDPEVPTNVVTKVIGISKDQSAAFSGRLYGEPYETDGTDINNDGITDDPYTGSHNLIWMATDDPSWTATFDDEAEVVADGVALKQSVTGATVTVKATELSDNDDIVFQIDPASGCTGKGEFWTGFRGVDQQTEVQGPLTFDPTGKLTETYAGMSSDVTLIETVTASNAGAVTSRVLNGAASLDAAFENAILEDGDDAVSIEFDTGSQPFDFWWESVP